MALIHGADGIIYFAHQFKPKFIEAGLLADEAPKDTGPDFGKASPFGLLIVVPLVSVFAQATARGLGVYWNNLPGGTTYCVGIAAAPNPASDPSGTFLRRDSDTTGPSAYPSFIATVDRTT